MECRSCSGLCAASPLCQRSAKRRKAALEMSLPAAALACAPLRAPAAAPASRARARSDLVPPRAALDGQVCARGRRDPHQLPGLCAPRGARPAQGGLARTVQPRRVPRALPQGAPRGAPARPASRPGRTWGAPPAQTGQCARLCRSRGCCLACLAAPPHRASRASGAGRAGGEAVRRGAAAAAADDAVCARRAGVVPGGGRGPGRADRRAALRQRRLLHRQGELGGLPSVSAAGRAPAVLQASHSNVPGAPGGSCHTCRQLLGLASGLGKPGRRLRGLPAGAARRMPGAPRPQPRPGPASVSRNACPAGHLGQGLHRAAGADGRRPRRGRPRRPGARRLLRLRGGPGRGTGPWPRWPGGLTPAPGSTTCARVAQPRGRAAVLVARRMRLTDHCDSAPC